MPTQKCLYLHPSAGTIQVDVNADYLFPRPNNNNDKAWKLLRDLPESQYGSTRDQQTPPLRRGNVYCALRPELVLDDTIVSRLKMLKMRYIDNIRFVSPHSQFCLDWILISCYLPNLYPTSTSTSTPNNSKNGTHDPKSTSPDLERTAAAESSWTALEAILTLLQTHSHFCKSIILQLRSNKTPSALYKEMKAAQQQKDAVLATLEKILVRIDQFYEAFVAPRHGGDDGDGDGDGDDVEFSIFPSPVAFDLYLAQAKLDGVEVHEGNWDLREGESRVWRSVRMTCDGEKGGSSSASSATATATVTSDAAVASEKGQKDREPGYWVKTDIIDWLECK